MGLREELLKAAAPPEKDVEIGGVKFRLVGLGMGEMMELSDMDGADATFWLLERMIQDGDGNRVFADDDPELRGIDPAVANKLAVDIGYNLANAAR